VQRLFADPTGDHALVAAAPPPVHGDPSDHRDDANAELLYVHTSSNKPRQVGTRVSCQRIFMETDQARQELCPRAKCHLSDRFQSSSVDSATRGAQTRCFWRGLTLVLQVTKTKGKLVTAVGWSVGHSGSSTGPILLGTSRGLVYETELQLNGSDSYWKQVPHS